MSTQILNGIGWFNGGPQGTIEVKTINITNPSSADFLIGSTKQIGITVLPANAADKTVVWKSSNTTVATINQNGLLTAKADGTTVITATSANGKVVSNNLSINVYYRFDSLAWTTTTTNVNETLSSSTTTKQVVQSPTPSSTALAAFTYNWTNANTSAFTTVSGGTSTSNSIGLRPNNPGTSRITCVANYRGQTKTIYVDMVCVAVYTIGNRWKQVTLPATFSCMTTTGSRTFGFTGSNTAYEANGDPYNNSWTSRPITATDGNTITGIGSCAPATNGNYIVAVGWTNTKTGIFKIQIGTSTLTSTLSYEDTNTVIKAINTPSGIANYSTQTVAVAGYTTTTQTPLTVYQVATNNAAAATVNTVANVANAGPVAVIFSKYNNAGRLYTQRGSNIGNIYTTTSTTWAARALNVTNYSIMAWGYVTTTTLQFACTTSTNNGEIYYIAPSTSPPSSFSLTTLSTSTSGISGRIAKLENHSRGEIVGNSSSAGRWFAFMTDGRVYTKSGAINGAFTLLKNTTVTATIDRTRIYGAKTTADCAYVIIGGTTTAYVSKYT